MEQNTAAPQPDWAALGWITHRQPTEADADCVGDVWLPREVADPIEGGKTFVHYRTVALGQPWYSCHAPEMQPTKPAPAQPDRIAALDQQMADRIAYLEERAAETIHALEQRVAELEERFAGLCTATATVLELMRPSAEPPTPTASRRVAQITGGDNWLVALCNDGTLLQLAKGTWTELPAIPQP